MKTLFRKLKKNPMALASMWAHSIVMTIAGLIMPRESETVLAAGLTCLALTLVATLGAVLVTELVEGQIVIEQQPQLTDVQAHTHRTHELPQAV